MSYKSKDIDLSVTDVIGKIPIRMLKEELEDRQKLKLEDPERWAFQEHGRHYNFKVKIDPEDYDLVDSKEVVLSDFDIDVIFSYLEDNGYEIFEKDYTPRNMSFDCFIKHLYDLPDWRFKEVICDMFGVSQLSSKEELLDAIKNKLTSIF